MICVEWQGASGNCCEDSTGTSDDSLECSSGEGDSAGDTEVLNESPIADENSALSFDILFAVWADCNDGSICLQELCLRMLYSYTRSYMDIWEIMGMCVVIVFCFLKVVFPVHISFLKFVLSFRCKGASKGRECVLHRVPIQFLHR